jgi:LacI family transcriptional regulator
MMTNRIRKPRRIVIEATGVVCRRSTETTGTSDAHLAAALRLIRDAEGETLSVERVVEVSTLSRSELERRFRDNLGRSIHEEIQIARLNLAKKLLCDSQLPIPQCATLAG